MLLGYINETKCAGFKEQTTVKIGFLWKKALATSAPYLSHFGPNYVLKVGGEALADPFLSPVFGSNNQTKPGVGDLMAYPGPTQRQIVLLRARTPSIQHTLGQENDVGAAEKYDRNNR